MGGITFWQTVIVLVLVSIAALVYSTIAKKAGFSRWWTLVLFVPIANVVLIWVFAYIEWPVEKNASGIKE
jgi:hypothetical protein